MYITDQEITVTWILPPTDSPLTIAAYDISYIPSTLEGTYTNGAVASFTAPSAVSSGSITYAFTTNSVGLFRLRLTVGSGDTFQVLEDETLWVFAECPTIAPCTVVLSAVGLPSLPNPPAFYNSLIQVDLGWNDIWGISQSVDNTDILWVVGTRSTLDDYPSIAQVKISDQSIIEYPDSVNMIGLYAGGEDDARNIVAGPGERLVVSKSTQSTNNEYDFFYSDPPYTNWTICTTDNTHRFAGYSELTYDIYLGLWFACSGVRMFVSSDGIDWVTQRADIQNNGGESVTGTQHQNIRVTTDSHSILYVGSPALGSGSERFIQSIAQPTDVLDPLPLASSLFIGITDIFGGTIPSKKSMTIMRSPDSDRVIWVTTNHLISTNVGDPFSWDAATIVDLTVLTGWSTGVINYAFWWEGAESGAGRYYIYTSLDVWWESVDAVTWTVSTNPQLTAWTDIKINAGLGTGRFCLYRGTLGGVAFVDAGITNNTLILAGV